MAKLIRCDAGHVFDSEKDRACPDCARLGITANLDNAEEGTNFRHNSPVKTGGAQTSTPIAEPTKVLAATTFTILSRHRLPLIAAIALAALAIGYFALRAGDAGRRQLMPEVAINKADLRNTPASAPAPVPAPALPPAPKPNAQPQDILPSTGINPTPESPLLPRKTVPAPTPQLSPAPATPRPSLSFVFDPSKITLDKIGETRSGWGALYFNPRTNGWGEAGGFRSESQAKRRALAECGGESEGCKYAASYHRRCGAIARASQSWAGGVGRNVEEAARDAYNDCTLRYRGNDCEILRVSCTR